MIRIARLLITLIALTSVANANDSASELAAGGLVLIKHDAITMQAEDLYLSPTEVRVRYEMRNNSPQPITVRVAFPLPELPIDTPAGAEILGVNGQSAGHNINIPTRDDPNFIGFQVKANGTYVTPQLQIRAVLPDGRDILPNLRAIGGWSLVLRPRLMVNVPGDDPFEFDVGPNRMRDLRALGALDGDEAGGMPRWKTLATYHWMQVFAPGVTIIEHRYRPIPGGFFLTVENGKPKGGALGTPDDLAAAYCLGQPHIETIQRWTTSTADKYVYATTLAYILSTGANWAGPIEHFHLTIDGGPTARLISACAEVPLTASGPSRLEGRMDNFRPRNELGVLMIRN